jgi:hypothetical protein
MSPPNTAARRAVKLSTLAERLYDYMPPVCWQTESNMASALAVSRRQIRYAKQHLIDTGLIRLELRENGKRSNPVHTLIKVNPINQYMRVDESPCELDWSMMDDIAPKDLNRMGTFEQLEFYAEMGFQTIPLHYPQFKPGVVYCSCKSGRNCPSIGKHPVLAWKGLDFSDRRTYRAMQSYWRDDINYNIGFLVDGFAVLDVDYRKGGQWSLAYLQDELGELPVGLSVATGNGRHIYVQTDHGLSNMVDVMGLGGLDVRAKGGIVAAPCSVHHSERQYEWESIGVPEQLPENWALNLQGGGDTRPRNNVAGRGANQPEVLVPTKPGADYVIPDGRRNTSLFKFASRERGKGADYDHILDVISTLNETYCEPPLRDSELRGIAASVTRYPTEAEKQKRGLPVHP